MNLSPKLYGTSGEFIRSWCRLLRGHEPLPWSLERAFEEGGEWSHERQVWPYYYVGQEVIVGEHKRGSNGRPENWNSSMDRLLSFPEHRRIAAIRHVGLNHCEVFFLDEEVQAAVHGSPSRRSWAWNRGVFRRRLSDIAKFS